MSTKGALIHAYAFYSGRLLNDDGYIESDYPSSIYKTKTILIYLVEHRDEPRAKFLLSMMTLKEGGLRLIREAHSLEIIQLR